MPWSSEEILETLRMTEVEHLDIRTTNLGISLRDCQCESLAKTKEAIYEKITRVAGRLVKEARAVENETGIRIANKRLAVTPVAIAFDRFDSEGMVEIAQALDRAADAVGVDYLGGFSALVQKGATRGDLALIEAIPQALNVTKHICSSVNLASTKAGMNMTMIAKMGHIIKKTAELTADRNGIGCAKLVVFANAVEDNPFIAGAFHGVSEPETVLNVGISGPGVVLDVVRRHPEASFGELFDLIKKTSFRITRTGELIGSRVANRLGVEFGIVDLSLAPTPEIGDSVGDILTAMGLEDVGAHGTTAALAMLNDAVKKGGMMASRYAGGLSGAFIPVSEDQGMIAAVQRGNLSLEKLEAMTCVCSVGLDMFAVPGDISPENISGIIADECAIGVVNNKTTAVRILPVPGKKVGDMVDYGGLLGSAPIQAYRKLDNRRFINRGGRIPAPAQGLRN
jgi:uncharacterized protein